MKTDLVVLGAGGFAREVLWLVEDCNANDPVWNVLGFIDENRELHGRTLCDVPVLGGLEWLNDKAGIHLISGVGGNAVRRRFETGAQEGMAYQRCKPFRQQLYQHQRTIIAFIHQRYGCRLLQCRR